MSCMLGIQYRQEIGLVLKSQDDSNLLARSCLLVLPTEEDANDLYQDLQFCHSLLDVSSDPLLFFPQRGDVPYEPMAPSIDLVAQRMQTLCQLVEGRPSVVVTSVQAVLQKLMPCSVFSNAMLVVKVGAVLEREMVLTRLLLLGYRRVSVVEIPGEFSVRGGIMDVFSTAYADPIRIEFSWRYGRIQQDSLILQRRNQSSIFLKCGFSPHANVFLQNKDGGTLPVELPSDGEWRCPDLYSTMDTIADYFPEPPLCHTGPSWDHSQRSRKVLGLSFGNVGSKNLSINSIFVSRTR